MSGKTRNRSARTGVSPASVTSDTQTINEKILKECNDIYINKENGLVTLAEYLGVKLLAPRKKVNILLIGNHSAGKSSYINWYIEKHVQKEGVAIETQGITFVTSGRKRETLTGNATFHLYPHLEPLRKVEGIASYLSTEICDSIAKRFPLVTFIDSPGLVDGNMNYSFDVNKVIQWLGNHSDLVFVFFDPIGQALCKRTMTVVAKMGETHSERIHFFLSKADEAGEETDRQRVLMQITQEVCKYPSLNRTSFDIKTIYNPNRSKPTRCVNQIEETAKSIEKVIQLTIQNTLNQLETDCNTMSSTVASRLDEDKLKRSRNWRAFFRSSMLSMINITIPLFLLLAYFSQGKPAWLPYAEAVMGNDTTFSAHQSLKAIGNMLSIIPSDYVWYFAGFYVIFTITLIVAAKVLGRSETTYTRKEKKKMNEISDYVQELVKTKRRQLYEEYLKQSVKGDHEF